MQPRTQALSSMRRKDPGWGWSRDASIFYCLRGDAKSIKLHASTSYEFFSTTAMLEYIAFLSCLEFAVLNSMYDDRILKPKQVLCLESLYLRKDLMCVLPTGYGKSLIFHLLPNMLLFAKYNLGSDDFQIWRRAWRSSKEISAAAINSIIVVVSPLNSLMNDQIARLRESSGIQASVVDVKELTPDEDDDDDVFNVDIDFRLCEKRKLRDGHYQIVFSQPEALISSKYGRELLLSQTYQKNVMAIVIDEAHCIVDWLVSTFLLIWSYSTETH